MNDWHQTLVDRINRAIGVVEGAYLPGCFEFARVHQPAILSAVKKHADDIQTAFNNNNQAEALDAVDPWQAANLAMANAFRKKLKQPVVDFPLAPPVDLFGNHPKVSNYAG